METDDGYRVEQVTVTRVDRPRTFLRIIRHGVFMADCETATQVAGHLNLATCDQPHKKRQPCGTR